MKIAMIAPPWISVPPAGYGGIEWVVALLADGLTDKGHDVTLFASGGSVTRAELRSTFDPAPGPEHIGDTYLETLHLHEAYDAAAEYDIVHDHTSLIGLALGVRQPTPVAHTIHGPLYPPFVRWYDMIDHMIHLVSISDSQREPAPELRYAGRVYNGIDLDIHAFQQQKEDFLFFVGRANPEKGVHTAVEVAHRAGRKLVAAVAIKEEHERAYWEQSVAPMLSGEEEILHEIPIEQKADLMGRAAAVLFPIEWPEPFGLVMAEANACGTPVLTFPRGAAPEVIADGETGFLPHDIDGMVEAIDRLDEIDPKACRARAEKLFSADAMVDGYLEVYERILSRAV
jgi:glycosyltransferase involved in cell wall biosynthesis